jgi:hypothetical protein
MRAKPSKPVKSRMPLAIANLVPAGEPGILLDDVRELILATRQTIARGVNAALVMLYWTIGQRIRVGVLQEKRAGYGQEIFPTLSRKLVVEFGRGFSQQNLFRMVEFAETFPVEKIVATLSQQLGWSHFVELIPLKKHLQRDFYAETCASGRTISSEPCMLLKKFSLH